MVKNENGSRLTGTMFQLAAKPRPIGLEQKVPIRIPGTAIVFDC